MSINIEWRAVIMRGMFGLGNVALMKIIITLVDWLVAILSCSGHHIHSEFDPVISTSRLGLRTHRHLESLGGN